MSAHEPYIDMLSVEICQNCPFDECHYYAHGCPLREAHEAQRQTKRMATLPGPRPDGVMRAWKVEVGI